MRAVLTYHSIDDSGSVISVDRHTFRMQMEWLAASGTRVVSLVDLMTLPADANALAITFDDGFQNFADDAWPVLRAHRLPVTVFVVSDCVGGSNRWSLGTSPSVPHLPLMDWSTLTRLGSEGVTYGSHTRSHPNLRSLSGQALTDEVENAAAALRERVGQPIEAFAYPYGGFNRETVREVAKVHSLACTTELRSLTTDNDGLRIPRLDAYYFRGSEILKRYGTGAFSRYVWLRAGGRRIRQAITRPVTA
jgi:peptidoglycan/xylan/chitin deacetylase (PgdA/CDA1 family)